MALDHDRIDLGDGRWRHVVTFDKVILVHEADTRALAARVQVASRPLVELVDEQGTVVASRRG